MRVAVYGGTFDPPHNTHLSLVRSTLDAGVAERAVFIPSADPPHKDLGRISPYALRLAMLKLAIAGEPRFEISEIEAQRLPMRSYTIDTMDELSFSRPDDHFILLIGSDSLEALHTWHRARELAERHELAVYPRKGHAPSLETLKNLWPEPLALKLHGSIIKGVPEDDLSSTWLRSTLANSGNAGKFIPKAVLDFIHERKLYGTA